MVGPNHLFVYGTLRRECANPMQRLLAKSATFAGAARMQGRLYQVASYPGLILTDGAEEWVRGEVHLLSDPSALLPVLDDYEGCGAQNKPPFEFERVGAEAILSDGRRVCCWVYVYGPTSRISEERRIVSGDFMDVPNGGDR
jgi:gamma-glutamylcyclotransferase (GGCT)/AIG2-like uncharacterized protein YtfP